jgi:hypothetical protein
MTVDYDKGRTVPSSKMITVLRGLDIKDRLTDHQVQSDLDMEVLTGFNWLNTRSHGGLL